MGFVGSLLPQNRVCWLPVALAALLKVVLDAALAVLPDLGDLGRGQEEGQQQRAVPVAAGDVDRHDDEASDPARGIQGAAADRARCDEGRKRRAYGRPDHEGGEGGGDHHGVDAPCAGGERQPPAPVPAQARTAPSPTGSCGLP